MSLEFDGFVWAMCCCATETFVPTKAGCGGGLKHWCGGLVSSGTKPQVEFM